MKAGDEVPAARFTDKEFLKMYESFTQLQIEWLRDHREAGHMDTLTLIHLFGVPSDAELQRREGK